MGIAYVVFANEHVEFATNLYRGDEGLERILLSGSIEKWWLAIQGFHIYQVIWSLLMSTMNSFVKEKRAMIVIAMPGAPTSPDVKVGGQVQILCRKWETMILICVHEPEHCQLCSSSCLHA